MLPPVPPQAPLFHQLAYSKMQLWERAWGPQPGFSAVGDVREFDSFSRLFAHVSPFDSWWSVKCTKTEILLLYFRYNLAGASLFQWIFWTQILPIFITCLHKPGPEVFLMCFLISPGTAWPRTYDPHFTDKQADTEKSSNLCHSTQLAGQWLS